MTPSSNLHTSKRIAAQKAFSFVRPGMRLGLGTGSTAALFVDILGEAVAQGFNVVCVPTSEATRQQAERLSIPLTSLDETPQLDLTIDGTDECDSSLRLIKGGGGALLREKIVANASHRLVIIADYTKYVETLGRFPLPIEIIPFGLRATASSILEAIRKSGCLDSSAPSLQLTLRTKKGLEVSQLDLPLTDTHILSRPQNLTDAFVTDEGHYIIDASLGQIPHPEEIARLLNAIPGVVDHGLFLNMADTIILASESEIRILGTG